MEGYHSLSDDIPTTFRLENHFLHGRHSDDIWRHSSHAGGVEKTSKPAETPCEIRIHKVLRLTNYDDISTTFRRQQQGDKIWRHLPLLRECRHVAGVCLFSVRTDTHPPPPGLIAESMTTVLSFMQQRF